MGRQATTSVSASASALRVKSRVRRLVSERRFRRCASMFISLAIEDAMISRLQA
jgi:hypothetical protein